ncbi:hypothetical protein, partial [Enterobacter hormaechei]|uniref:hypothetical protein n=1 Tax=Enterobacter hormaechei TaxID=158836 RepID=UPI001CC2B606
MNDDATGIGTFGNKNRNGSNKNSAEQYDKSKRDARQKNGFPFPPGTLIFNSFLAKNIWPLAGW